MLPLLCYVVKGLINTSTYKLAAAFVYIDVINWLKNKTCRPTNDSWHLLNKAGENGKLPSLDIPSATACFHSYKQAAQRPDNTAVTAPGDTMTNPFPVKYKYDMKENSCPLPVNGDSKRGRLYYSQAVKHLLASFKTSSIPAKEQTNTPAFSAWHMVSHLSYKIQAKSTYKK